MPKAPLTVRVDSDWIARMMSRSANRALESFAQESVFNDDKVTFKVRYEFGNVPVYRQDYRLLANLGVVGEPWSGPSVPEGFEDGSKVNQPTLLGEPGLTVGDPFTEIPSSGIDPDSPLISQYFSDTFQRKMADQVELLGARSFAHALGTSVAHQLLAGAQDQYNGVFDLRRPVKRAPHKHGVMVELPRRQYSPDDDPRKLLGRMRKGEAVDASFGVHMDGRIHYLWRELASYGPSLVWEELLLRVCHTCKSDDECGSRLPRVAEGAVYPRVQLNTWNALYRSF